MCTAITLPVTYHPQGHLFYCFWNVNCVVLSLFTLGQWLNQSGLSGSQTTLVRSPYQHIHASAFCPNPCCWGNQTRECGWMGLKCQQLFVVPLLSEHWVTKVWCRHSHLKITLTIIPNGWTLGYPYSPITSYRALTRFQTLSRCWE